MDAKSIIANLERLRELNHLTKVEVAVKLGVSRNTYLNLVSGQTKVINENLPALADLFHVELDELLLGYKPINKESQMLRESEQYEEKRRALIDEYETLLAAEREKNRTSEERIADLRQHVETLQALNRMQQSQLDKK